MSLKMQLRFSSNHLTFQEDHGSQLASNLTVEIESVSNTDMTYNSPWDEAKPEDNVFDLEVEAMLLDRPELTTLSTNGGGVSMRVDASIGRSEKSVCAQWDVKLVDDDSVKPVLDVNVVTDISEDSVPAVGEKIQVNVKAQHRHRSSQDDEDMNQNETSTAEAKALKLGFYLPP